MSEYYILRDGKPVNVPFEEWYKLFDRKTKQVKLTTVAPEVVVSTIFLGMDHSWEPYGKPVLWETMIFGGDHDQYQERYTSEEDAKEGHENACKIALGEVQP